MSAQNARPRVLNPAGSSLATGLVRHEKHDTPRPRSGWISTFDCLWSDPESLKSVDSAQRLDYWYSTLINKI
jgi:hypothetical protein